MPPEAAIDESETVDALAVPEGEEVMDRAEAPAPFAVHRREVEPVALAVQRPPQCHCLLLLASNQIWISFPQQAGSQLHSSFGQRRRIVVR